MKTSSIWLPGFIHLAAWFHHLAAWFHHLARRKDPAYLKSLDDAFEAIDGGDQMTLDAYQKLSQELNQSGV